MKINKLLLTMAGLTLLLPLASAQAQSSELGCRIRANQLENELNSARANDSRAHIVVLERELAKVRGNCAELRTGDRSYSNIQNRKHEARQWNNEREHRLNETRAGVREREARGWNNDQN